MRPLLFALVALLATGCVGTAAQNSIEALSKSERSWCVAVTSIYGTMRAGGTGIQGGTMSCTQDRLSVTDKEKLPTP
jgi:hypothetical protein